MRYRERYSKMVKAYRNRRLALFCFFVLLAGCEVMPSTPVLSNQTRLRNAPPSVAHDMGDNPTDASSAMQRADQFFRTGNKDEALYYYVKALEFDDKSREALDRIGDIHSDKGNYDLAEAAYRMALKLDPRDADALAGLGFAQLNAGKQADAKNSLAAALAINPQLWRAINGLGLLADKNGDYQAAAQYYDSALKIKPDMPMLLNNRGYSKYLSGDLPGALLLFDLAAKNDSQYDVAWLNKALVYARLGDEASAMQAFRHVLDEADTYNNLGYIYMMNGKTDRAYECFEKAIALSPTYHKLAHENLNRLRQVTNKE